MDIPSEPYVVGRSFKPNVPSGESKFKMNTDYSYDTSCNDPESDQVFYRWDWGDGKVSKWLGPYNSGETCRASHNWTEIGNYQISVLAKDVSGFMGSWSDPFSISVTKDKNRIYVISFIQFLINYIRRFLSNHHLNLFLILQTLLQRFGLL